MEFPAMNNSLLSTILVRILSFGVLILAVRFAYFVALAGGSCVSEDFCFFPDNIALRGGATVRNWPSSIVSGSGESQLRDLWTTKKWRKAVDYYSSIFQDFFAEGFLSPDSRALCVDTVDGEDVFALREISVADSVGISPLSLSGESNAFDFVFAGNGSVERSGRPADFASWVGRTLKPGGFFVAHTMAARDAYSFISLLELFNCCRLIRSREIDGVEFPAVREIVMKKEMDILYHNRYSDNPSGSLGNKCSFPEIIRNAEPIVQKEPLKPWIELKKNIKKVKYLTSMVDISFKRRYVYIDIGARSYGSSIGSWFKKQYPKQNKTFEIYAIEADRAFHEQYKSKKGIVLVPYAAWVRNETLFFEITRDPSKKSGGGGGGRGMGRIQPASYMGDVDKIQGFDFADWLKKTVSERDFVVVKMDVEGTEFHLVPRLIETGAMCLIDEIFLECHYNRWQRCCPGQRSIKYQKTYGQCLELFSKLRDIGVLVHQWW